MELYKIAWSHKNDHLLLKGELTSAQEANQGECSARPFLKREKYDTRFLGNKKFKSHPVFKFSKYTFSFYSCFIKFSTIFDV